jgi:pantetheine-phosphate adenylyltransferase
MNRAAIYAGTFDPITLGHLDVVERAARVFPRLILAVAVRTTKEPLFSLDERVAIARESVAGFPSVEVEPFDGLLVAYARRKKVGVLVRGLRAFSDFEFEFQMALTNRKLAPDIETLFLMPSEDYSYVSSSTVRQIAELGGSVRQFVPEPSRQALARKLGLAAADRAVD